MVNQAEVVMRRRLLLIGSVTFGVLWATESFAQGTRNKFSMELVTVNELRVATAPLSEQAAKCGLTARDLETPARTVLETSTLRMLQSSTNIIFVNANLVSAGDMCVAAIDVELFRWSNEYRVSVSVWSRESVIAGGHGGFSDRIREKVETLTKEFVADWTRARR
jgi:hypothetical protein